MTDPIPGVKYRIQSVDLQMYLELLDSTIMTNWGDNARLRPMKETDRQFWTFEKVPNYNGLFHVRNVASTYHCLGLDSTISTLTGKSSTTYGLVHVTQLSDGAYRLSFFLPSNSLNYYWCSQPDSTSTFKLDHQKNDLDSQKWRLVPVAPHLAVKSYLPETGVYRIRNLNGRSLLTCDGDDSQVYVESQLDQSNRSQRWNVTFEQASGMYVIQNAGNNLYLGCPSATPSAGDNLVGVETAFQWDIQIFEGFSVSFCIPNEKLSIGLADYEVGHEWEPSLQIVPSDVTASQMWYMENLQLTLIRGDKLYADRHLPEGKYLLQSCHDHTIYMNGACSPYRVITGTAGTSEFELKYIDKKSALFALTYVTGTDIVAVLADAGDYIALNRKGTHFALAKKGRDQYTILLPGSGDPRKVVSARLTTDIDGNRVCAIEDETGEALQRWKFIPVQ